jgi:hypothetical protein
MSDNKQFIIDQNGAIQSVIIDYATFHKMEEAILDAGLQKAMEEVEDEKEIGLEEAMRLAKAKNAH